MCEICYILERRFSEYGDYYEIWQTNNQISRHDVNQDINGSKSDMGWKLQLILSLRVLVSVMIAIALFQVNSQFIQPIAFFCLIIIAVKYGLR